MAEPGTPVSKGAGDVGDGAALAEGLGLPQVARRGRQGRRGRPDPGAVGPVAGGAAVGEIESAADPRPHPPAPPRRQEPAARPPPRAPRAGRRRSRPGPARRRGRAGGARGAPRRPLERDRCLGRRAGARAAGRWMSAAGGDAAARGVPVLCGCGRPWAAARPARGGDRAKRQTHARRRKLGMDSSFRPPACRGHGGSLTFPVRRSRCRLAGTEGARRGRFRNGQVGGRLGGRWRGQGAGGRQGPWVLPGPDPTKPLTTVDNTWRRLCEMAGVSVKGDPQERPPRFPEPGASGRRSEGVHPGHSGA